MNIKSSTPMAWELILKPALKAYNLNNKVNKLLDYYEDENIIGNASKRILEH